MYLFEDDGYFYELAEDEYELAEADGGFWLYDGDQDVFCEFVEHDEDDLYDCDEDEEE